MLNQLRQNWKAGLSVALVNIPLSISLAIASGTTPTAGIITAIVAGFISAIIGGSHFNVIGPAGALSGILALYALKMGMGILPLLAFASGVVIILVWYFKLDRYIDFIPSSVIHGFTLAVAIIIGLSQLNFAFGLRGLATHEHLLPNVWESLKNIGNTEIPTLILFTLGTAMMFVLWRKFPKIPNSIVVAILGIGVGVLSSASIIPFQFETIQKKFGTLSLSFFNNINFSSIAIDTSIVTAIVVVMIITILETILSAKVADGMTGTKHNQRKEVLGIGLANIASGIVGGMPATGVFARTALNIRSGATSRYSGIINSLAILLISFFLLRYFSYLPLAIIAAILVYVAFRMVAHEHFIRLWRFDRPSFWTSLVAAALSVIYDPLYGILLGTSLAFILYVSASRSQPVEMVIKSHEGELKRGVTDETYEFAKSGKWVMIRFVGPLTFVTAQSYRKAEDYLKNVKNIIFNLKNITFTDLDGTEQLHEFIKDLERQGSTIAIGGAQNGIEKFLHKLSWYISKEEEGLIFKDVFSACEQFESKNLTK